MNARKLAPALGLALAAAAFAGCQNPFDPEADLRLITWTANGGLVVQVTQSLAATTEMQSTWTQFAQMTIGNFSAVSVSFSSYVVVYRQIGAQEGASPQPAGSPIPSLGGAGGRRYPLHLHVQGLENNTGTFVQADVILRVVTKEFLSYIAVNPSTINGGIDCEVELFGTDHNGHDVKVGGSLHVEVF